MVTLPRIGHSAISTHAPRTGSDPPHPLLPHPQKTFQPTLPARGATSIVSRTMPTASVHFNPRSPHGERLVTTLPTSLMGAFQPTLPARGATRDTLKQQLADAKFQPTLPARGATLLAASTARITINFNPRSPHGERRHRHPCSGGAVPISTHAPRTGSDQEHRAGVAN